MKITFEQNGDMLLSDVMTFDTFSSPFFLGQSVLNDFLNRISLKRVYGTFDNSLVHHVEPSVLERASHLVEQFDVLDAGKFQVTVRVLNTSVGGVLKTCIAAAEASGSPFSEFEFLIRAHAEKTYDNSATLVTRIETIDIAYLSGGIQLTGEK